MPRSTRGLEYTATDLRPPWRRAARGVGRPVVFHHGIGTNQDIWAEWLPIVAAQHPVLRFDTRGYGQSTVPPSDHSWTMDEMVDDLLEIAGLAEGGPVHLVGESLGGTAVLAAALREPARILSVTVSNTAHRGAGIKRVMGWREEAKRAGMLAWSRAMMDLRFLPGAISQQQRAWFEAEQNTAHEHVTIGLGEMLAATDLTSKLARFVSPLLILMPDQSPFVPARMGAELHELVPHSELCIFPGVRHGLPFSHAKPCADLLLRFLEKVEAGPGPRPPASD